MEAWRLRGGEAERVGAGRAAVLDFVGGRVAADQVAVLVAVHVVSPGPAGQEVVAGSADDLLAVVADAAVEGIAAGVAFDFVVAALAEDRVVTGASDQQLVAKPAVSSFGPRRAFDFGDARFGSGFPSDGRWSGVFDLPENS